MMRKLTVAFGLYMSGAGFASAAAPVKQQIYDFLRAKIQVYAGQATENCSGVIHSEAERQAVIAIIVNSVTLQAGPNGALLNQGEAEASQKELQEAMGTIRVANPAAYDCAARAVGSVNSAVMSDFIAKAPEFERAKAAEEENSISSEQAALAQQKADALSNRIAKKCFGYEKDNRISEKDIRDLAMDSVILGNKKYFSKSSVPVPDAHVFDQRWSEFADKHYGVYECVSFFVGRLNNKLIEANPDDIH